MLARQDYFCLISEVYLNNLIAQSKHDGMLGFHPFFHVAVASVWRGVFVQLNLRIRVQIVPEVLQQGYFLLKLPFGGIIA